MIDTLNDMALLARHNDSELVRLVDNKPDATALERVLAARLYDALEEAKTAGAEVYDYDQDD